MKMIAWMNLVSPLFFVLAQLGEEEHEVSPSRIVGSVYGNAVTAGDIKLAAPIGEEAIGFSARNTAQWELMGRITSAFGGEVLQRFITERKIEATDEEIEKFQRNFQQGKERNARQWEAALANVKQQLATSKISAGERAELQKEQTTYEVLLASQRLPVPDKSTREIAKMFIVSWKTERELHRVYGGRVIFQQAGPEALDARRRLYEQAEKKGDLKFEDAGVRHMFYYYSKMKHVVTDEKVLERPWFLDDVD